MQPSNKKSTSTNGFSLIEIVAVLTIVAIILPTVVLGLGMAGKKSAEAVIVYRNAVVADSILKRTIEELNGLSYSDSELNIVTNRSFNIDEYNFSGTLTIAYVDDQLSASATDIGYKKITVSVTTPDATLYSIDAIITD